MADWKDNEEVLPALLDRLTDEEPQNRNEGRLPRAQVVRSLKKSLRRDLEWLLNTRSMPNLPPELKEVQGSVLAFGLPDMTTFSARNPGDKAKLRRTVERALETFEPRLEGIVVTVDADPGPGLAMKFRIDARLKVDPAPEPVSFDTLLQVGSGEFRVKGE